MLRRSSLLLVLLLVFVACTGGSDASTTTASTVPGETTTSVEGQPQTTEGGAPTTTSVPASVPTTEPDLSGLQGVSAEVIAELEDLVRVAQQIRDLPFIETPQITVLSEDQFEARVREDIVDETDDLPADEALYKMLGLLADGADFETLLLDLYGEQVAGFYDGDTGEIVVPTRQEGFSLIQRGTLVHELVHALTDQHFTFNPKFQTMIDEDRLDEAAAYQALIEGDATLAEVLWVQTLSQREIGEFIAESLDVDSATLEAAPRFLRESLLFPYDTGLGFVQSLYLPNSDWEAINDAYSELATLPGSTEQVITPDDYTRDLPIEVGIPDVDVVGYELERTSVWGEEGFRIMLNQGSTESSMVTAADGWGGDSYHQWFDGENAAMLIVFEGDTQTDVDELEEALLAFAQDSFPEEHFAWVARRDGDLYFIAADVPAVGEQIRSAVGLG